MSALLALASALLLGSADFTGGLAAKEGQATTVVVWSNATGLAVALVLVAGLSGGLPTRADMLWGAAAGVFGAIGAVLLYRALADGVMSVVAPLTAGAAASVPVVFGLAGGDPIHAGMAYGLGMGLVSIPLLSMSRRGADERTAWLPIGMALLAGLGFGAFYVCLAQTASASSLWPLVAARCASLPVMIATALLAGGSLKVEPRVARLAVLCGVLDMLSSALFVAAVRIGYVSIAGLLASLYPLSTLLLARAILRERPRPIQQVGVALALGSVLLLAR